MTAMKATGKVKYILLFLIVFLITAVITVWLCFLNKPVPRKENGIPVLSFSAGEQLKGYEIADSSGNRLDVGELWDMPSLVVFAMKGCGDCKADYDAYRVLFSLYNTDAFKVVFIWDDEIPQAELDEMRIPPSASYSAEGRYKFTDWVPTYFLLDETGEILFETEHVEEAAQQLPVPTVTPQGLHALTGGKPLLLVDDAEKYRDAAVEKNLSEDAFMCFVSGEENCEKTNEAVFCDPYDLVSKAFQVEAYPTWIYLEDENIVIES